MAVSPIRLHACGFRTALPWGRRRITIGAAIHRPKAITELTLPGAFTTTLGAELPEVKLRVEAHGLASLPPSRTVLICPSFSHSSHVASNSDDPSPGWWQDIVGPSKAIDSRHWRILCVSVLGGPYAPTNPCATDPRTGRPYRASFPQLTPTDLARVHAAALEALGVRGSIHAAVGASLGGMQVCGLVDTHLPWKANMGAGAVASAYSVGYTML
jgi:homoserine O-acetyltransferase